jgi:hypothetical protein
MISVVETRRRVDKSLYKVLTVYLFGWLPLLRTWELLTVPGHLAAASERE